MRFEIHPSRRGLTTRQRLAAMFRCRKAPAWDWRLRGENGQIVATSAGQGYERSSDAREAIQRLLVLGQSAEIVETRR
ncbi:MAG: YegP family protein [Acidobacteria bacterium]|nr:YegP family protein [Acidobacteriota bacterium]